jgi:hypothetical protein
LDTFDAIGHGSTAKTFPHLEKRQRLAIRVRKAIAVRLKPYQQQVKLAWVLMSSVKDEMTRMSANTVNFGRLRSTRKRLASTT